MAKSANRFLGSAQATEDMAERFKQLATAEPKKEPPKTMRPENDDRQKTQAEPAKKKPPARKPKPATPPTKDRRQSFGPGVRGSLLDSFDELYRMRQKTGEHPAKKSELLEAGLTHVIETVRSGKVLTELPPQDPRDPRVHGPFRIKTSVKLDLHQVHLDTGHTKADLVERALRHLFSKYDVARKANKSQTATGSDTPRSD